VAVAIDGPEQVGISSLVLGETVHVLRGPPYHRRNPDLADALVELLAHESIVLTDLDAELASAAIGGVRHLSPRHIADALISASAHQAGASALLTNDRAFASTLVTVRQLEDAGPG
jgi:predicted nucleic acid-binding protein